MVESQDSLDHRSIKSKKRELRGFFYWIVFGIAVSFSLFELYAVIFKTLLTMHFRVAHLMFASALIFCLYPFSKRSPIDRITVSDILLAALAIATGAYMLIEYEEIVWRIGIPTRYDIIFGCIAIILTLEIARRTSGFVLPLVAIIFIIYTSVLGPYSPGVLHHKNIDYERLFSQLYLTMEGIYGVIMGVMAEYVYLFILFGAFLVQTKANRFFLNLAYALTGTTKGGPAQTAVFGSALLGSISGSATANVLTTGTFTIPLMKKAGYKPQTAGGIEVASSVGSQMMPPIMGSGALIMSDFTGVPYVKIIAIAFIPACLYYLSLAAFVHFRAGNLSLQGLPREKLPNVWNVLKEGYHFLVPFFTLIYLLIKDYTPQYAVLGAIASLFLISFLRKSSRMSFRDILDALARGAQSAITISSVLACVGIIIGCVGLTGVAHKISALMLSVGNTKFVLMVLVLFISLILGMELPITAAYIVLIVLAGPALQQLGIPVIVAHMVVFWFSQDSAVTPPVCITSYVAASVANANPVKTGIEAWKCAKALYIIPFLFVYTPILTGNIFEILRVTVFAIPGLLALASALERRWFHKLNLVESAIMLIAGFVLLFADLKFQFAGCLLFAINVLINYKQIWKKQTSRYGDEQ